MASTALTLGLALVFMLASPAFGRGLNGDGYDDIGIWVPTEPAGVRLTGFEQVRATGSAADEIPSWVRTTASWWVEGTAPDGRVARSHPAPELEKDVLSGLWIPRGRGGRKLLLILDEASQEALVERIVEGTPVPVEGAELLGTPKVLLKARRDGRLLVQVRARVALDEGKVRLRYKARMTGADSEAPAEGVQIR